MKGLPQQFVNESLQSELPDINAQLEKLNKHVAKLEFVKLKYNEFALRQYRTQFKGMSTLCSLTPATDKSDDTYQLQVNAYEIGAVPFMRLRIPDVSAFIMNFVELHTKLQTQFASIGKAEKEFTKYFNKFKA